AVAIWTNTSDPSRMIRTAIGYAPRMVRFEIWCSICSVERCRFFATFTDPVCTSKNVSSHVLAAFINSALRFGFHCAYRSGSRLQGLGTKLLHRTHAWGLVHRYRQIVERYQMKNDCFALLSISVYSGSKVPS